jgi:hypothetical protein
VTQSLRSELDSSVSWWPRPGWLGSGRLKHAPATLGASMHSRRPTLMRIPRPAMPTHMPPIGSRCDNARAASTSVVPARLASMHPLSHAAAAVAMPVHPRTQYYLGPRSGSGRRLCTSPRIRRGESAAWSGSRATDHHAADARVSGFDCLAAQTCIGKGHGAAACSRPCFECIRTTSARKPPLPR